MAGPSLKLGADEFGRETPRTVRKKPGAVKKLKKAAKTGSEFYNEKIAPHKRALLLVLAGVAAVTGASFVGSSFYESHQERKAQVARETEEIQTPKASLKLKVRAKHDGHGKISNFEVEDIPEIDACGEEHTMLPNIYAEDLGQGLYKMTVILATSAHGRDLKYSFSFEIDDKGYDFMPVEATLVQ